MLRFSPPAAMIATLPTREPQPRVLSTAVQDDDDNEDPSDESGDAGASVVRGGAYALVKPLVDGAAELRAFHTNSNANFCFQAPVVVTKSSSSPPNGVCPTRWSRLSCVCVTGVSTSAHWDLRVMKRVTNAAMATQKVTDPIAVTSIGIFILPNNVASLWVAGAPCCLSSECCESWEVLTARVCWMRRRLTGDSAAQPLSVELRLLYQTNKESASTPQLVMISAKSALRSVYVQRSYCSVLSIRNDALTLPVLDQRGDQHRPLERRHHSNVPACESREHVRSASCCPGSLKVSWTSVHCVGCRSLQQCRIAAVAANFLAERHQSLETLYARDLVALRCLGYTKGQLLSERCVVRLEQEFGREPARGVRRRSPER